MNTNAEDRDGIAADEQAPWLLLMFTLPARQASRRVEVWRKLRKYGTVALRTSGYLLPNTSQNQERFEWLAAAIRKYKGQASVAQLHAIDDLPSERLRQMFVDGRSKEYEMLLRELKKRKNGAGNLPRLRRRLQEIAAVDFFGSPIRSRVETTLAALENPNPEPNKAVKHTKREFQARTWITRPRPGIDRVSSAWLIRNHIDLEAQFAFTNAPQSIPEGVPYDMFNVGGFTHQGENCTFETLCAEFEIRDRKIKALAEIIHDADLNDEKFGRSEGVGIDRVLTGWAQQDLTDEELLKRGMELIDGLYAGIE